MVLGIGIKMISGIDLWNGLKITYIISKLTNSTSILLATLGWSFKIKIMIMTPISWKIGKICGCAGSELGGSNEWWCWEGEMVGILLVIKSANINYHMNNVCFMSHKISRQF